MPKDESGFWKLVSKGGVVYHFWSDPHISSKEEAKKKFHRIKKKSNEIADTTSVDEVCIQLCTVDGCWSFAKTFLEGEDLEFVEKKWWFVSYVERKPGDALSVATICPMCERHANRFKKDPIDRIFRIEQRLDELQKSFEGHQYDDTHKGED